MSAWCNCSDVGSFRTIAKGACVGQVLCFGWATVLLGNDVLYLAPEIGVVFVNQAVFAHAVCPRFDEATEISTDIAGHRGQKLRARALARRIKCSRFMNCS